MKFAATPGRFPLFRWSARLSVCLCVLAGSDAGAKSMHFFDLDSLAYMSSEVVEGRFVKGPLREREDVAEVELTAVYKGGLQPGQTVSVAYLAPYVVGEPFVQHRSFEPGDAMFLFLNPVTATEAYNRLPADRTYHGVVPSGVKLVRDGKVFGFVQMGNRGPYGLITSSPDDPASSPSGVAAFRQSLIRRVPEMERLKDRFADRPSLEDRGWLLELLQRPAPSFGFADALAMRAADRVATLHDLPLLKEALARNSSYDVREVLARGYAFPAGRESLLKRIADSDAAMAERVACASLLENVDAAYDTYIQDGSNRSLQWTGPHSEANAHYLTRIAGLAFRFVQDQELCGTILGSLNALVRSCSSDNLYPGVKEDCAGVTPILSKLVGSASSKKIKDDAQQMIDGQRTRHGSR